MPDTMSGCEDERQADDRKPGSTKSANEEKQHALKQFPFVKIREYNGEKLVPWLRTPGGKLWADRRSTIRICIDPTGLLDDGIFSQGDVSLGAKLGDRELVVDGYAEVGKNYEKFKPAAVRTDRFVLSYATMRAAATDPDQSSGGIARRAAVISEIVTGMLSNGQSTYALSRITNTSEEEIKNRAKALKDAVPTWRPRDATAPSQRHRPRRR